MKITLEDVNYGYSADQMVLHDINLTIDTKGLVCIIGPNGVGKSTLIRCINKLIKPISGNVYIDGRNLNDIPLKELSQRMSYVPVKTQDCFSMNLIDTILVGRHNKSKWRTTEEDLEAVYKVITLMGLDELKMRNFNELSAGQHQKVAIARGLVQEPEVLILDEPTSNLDARHQIYVTQMLRAIAEQQDMTVIMICHDLNVSAKYANEIIVMAPPGIIYGKGKPEDVITASLIEDVYKVKCEIINDEGKPHVLLKSQLPSE